MAACGYLRSWRSLLALARSFFTDPSMVSYIQPAVLFVSLNAQWEWKHEGAAEG
jgi:hypothetical protein